MQNSGAGGGARHKYASENPTSITRHIHQEPAGTREFDAAGTRYPVEFGCKP